MRHLLIPLVLFLSGCCSTELSGTVRDAERMLPVAGAFVFVEGAEDVETDAGGAFRVELPCDEVTIRITAPGYEDRFDRRKLDGGTVRVSYALKPLAPEDAPIAPDTATECVDCEAPIPAGSSTCPGCGARRLSGPR